MTNKSNPDFIDQFSKGSFLLIHDNEFRENETDIMIAGEFITPQKITQMRTIGGGLLCVAIPYYFADKVGIPFMREILRSAGVDFPTLSQIIDTTREIDLQSSHSITFNSRDSGGVTDYGRCKTVSDLVTLIKSTRGIYDINSDSLNPRYANHLIREHFLETFESPGHLQLLIANKDLLKKRQGHTEISIFLTQKAKLSPVVVMCEMLDDENYRSRPVDDCKKIAETLNMPFVESDHIVDLF